MCLGEPGTEQFEVETSVNDEIVSRTKVHDPFARTTVVIDWRGVLRALWERGSVRVVVRMSGTQAAERRIMMLDPVAMERENREFYAHGDSDLRALEHACTTQITDGKANVNSTLPLP